MGWRATALLALSLLTLAGCAEQGLVDDASVALSERRDFRTANNDGSTAAWSGFLDKYPDSALRPKAEAALEDAAWREAAQTNTARGYLSFLQQRPDNKMAGEARDRCRKLLEGGQGSEADIVDYLGSYPDDPEGESLRRALEGVRYAAVQNASDPNAAALFVAQYPGTPEATKLLPGVEEQAYQDAEKNGSRLALEFYLKRYPRSPRAGEVEKALSGLPSSPVSDGGQSLALLPKLRDASPELRAQECRRALAEDVRSAADPMSSQAERARSQLSALARGTADSCGDRKFTVPAPARPLVGAAVRALTDLAQRQARLTSSFAAVEGLAEKAGQIADASSKLADDSESFELELEAYFGSMPADPEHPEVKASRNAQDAARRARSAVELAQDDSVAQKKDAAQELMNRMNDQAQLLTRIIAFYEKPSRRGS